MDLTDSFLDYLRYERNYSQETVKAYREDLMQFEAYCAKETKEESYSLAEVGTQTVRGWILSLMDENVAVATVNRKLSTLRSFYRFLMKRGVCQNNPMLKIVGPKKKKRLPVFVKEKEMDRLLDDVDFGEGFEACRDRAIVEVFYLTGIRLSELIGLKDEDVDFSSSLIKVTGKRNKQRLIPFGEELKKDLQVYVKMRDEYVKPDVKAFFVRKSGEQLYRSIVESIVTRSLSKVVTLKKKSPHVLRHTFATMMLNHDAQLTAIKELLGHESLTTTEVYTHTTFEELKRMYNQAHPRA